MRACHGRGERGRRAILAALLGEGPSTKQLDPRRRPLTPAPGRRRPARVTRGELAHRGSCESPTRQYGRTQVIGSRSSDSIQPASQVPHTNESAIHSVGCQTSGWMRSRSSITFLSPPHMTSIEPQAGQVVGELNAAVSGPSSIVLPASAERASLASARSTSGRPRGSAVPTSLPLDASSTGASCPVRVRVASRGRAPTVRSAAAP
jgi:hypothetical protein